MVLSKTEYLKLGVVQGLLEKEKEVCLAVEAKNIPTVQIVDGCGINVKGADLVESNIGIPSTFSICNTHIAHGAIRRGTCVSKSKKPWDDMDSDGHRTP